MKKAFNPDILANELQDTGFFRRPPAPESHAVETTPSDAAAQAPRHSEAQEAAPVVSPVLPQADSDTQATTTRPNARTPERASARTPVRSVESPAEEAPKRRQARRSSFEIYEDQIERIKRIALENQLNGGVLSQSHIVRAALDRYLDALEKKQ